MSCLIEVSTTHVEHWEKLFDSLLGTNFEGPDSFRTSTSISIKVALRGTASTAGTSLAVQVDAVDAAFAKLEGFTLGPPHHFAGGVSHTVSDQSGSSVLIYQLHDEGEEHV